MNRMSKKRLTGELNNNNIYLLTSYIAMHVYGGLDGLNAE